MSRSGWSSAADYGVPRRRRPALPRRAGDRRLDGGVVEGEGGGVLIVDGDATCCGFEKSREEIDEGAFAGAGGADKGNHFTGSGVKIDVF